MSEIIETISDENLYEESFNKYFLKKDSFIKTGSMNINADYLGFKENYIILRINEDIPDDQVILFTRIQDVMVFSKINLKQKRDDGIYIYKPCTIQIMKIARKEGRKAVNGTSGEGRQLYISSMVAEYNIQESLVRVRKKVDLFKDKLVERLQKYSHAGVYFLGDKSMDPRMKYFYSDRVPIYVPDISSDDFNEKENEFHKFYKISVFESDRKVDWRKIISEISVPLIYKMMPVGYIQVNHVDTLTEEEFSSIRKLGSSFSEVMVKNDIIVPSDEKILVVDMSKSGLGLVFKERHFIKFFKDNSYIFFNIILPGEKIVPVYCIIRNLNLIKNNLFRVGCEIVEMDALGETHYDEFLDE